MNHHTIPHTANVEPTQLQALAESTLDTLLHHGWDGDAPGPIVGFLMELGDSLIALGRSPAEVASLYGAVGNQWRKAP